MSVSTVLAAPAVSVPFSSLDLDPAIINVLQKRGIVDLTPIQERAIPLALEGRDVVGIAQTGTGKTLAFVLPIIARLAKQPGQALVLVPTRELALQVEETFSLILRGTRSRLETVVLIGGAPMRAQIQSLRRKPAIIVATPGRLQDHLMQRTLSLAATTVVVLDEADRMFDMGFAPAIKQILKAVPQKRQTMLFSATMPGEIAALAAGHLTNPERIEASPPGTSVKAIQQEVCFVNQNEKIMVLEKLLGACEGLTLVFSRTKHGAKSLAKRIKSMGHSSAEIHSNRSLSQRRHALNGFRSGNYRVLVATDIAARGIDVDDIELVVNYDLPDAAEDYVHRVGRTGRAGRTGKAISLATIDQSGDVKQIERLIKHSLLTSEHSLARPEGRPSVNGGARRNGSNRNGGSRNGTQWRRPRDRRNDGARFGRQY